MILIIDNYDSFVYTLAGYVQKIGAKTLVLRNDKVTIEEITALNPAAIIISPGPCKPQDAGICIDIIRTFGKTIPILGVCLGHQAIGEAYGGQTMRAQKPVHGKTSDIEHDGSILFHNMPSPITAGRYHSLISDLTHCDSLKITALSDTDEIMAVQHLRDPVFGVQFHPESTLTPYGLDIIKNFLTYARDWHTEHKNQ
tara:strand:+ start:34903 stop:35496 length:594 start_codon:yes stop_codon:yes gene_type:complete